MRYDKRLPSDNTGCRIMHLPMPVPSPHGQTVLAEKISFGIVSGMGAVTHLYQRILLSTLLDQLPEWPLGLYKIPWGSKFDHLAMVKHKNPD